MKHCVVNVTEFKRRCLALLDDVGTRGGTITITKRGRPLATVGPANDLAWKSPEGSWTRKITIAEDIVLLDNSGLWEALDKKARTRI